MGAGGEEGGGQGRGGWIKGVSELGECGWLGVCVCRGLECWPWSWVWTQCLPQGVGAPPAMLRERSAGFPKKLGGRASGEAG